MVNLFGSLGLVNGIEMMKLLYRDSRINLCFVQHNPMKDIAAQQNIVKIKRETSSA